MGISTEIVQQIRVGISTQSVERNTVKRIAFADRSFLVPFGVFNPVKHQSGALVADYLQRNANDFAGTRVLEIGTGSGLLAAVLHDAGATVVATDISRLAVEAARGNLAGTNVDVRLGDLFDPVAGERFDIIVSNPPYEVGSSLRPRYRSADLLERLAATWREYGDQLVLAFPTDAADQLEQLGFTLTLSERLRSTGRELGIYRSA